MSTHWHPFVWQAVSSIRQLQEAVYRVDDTHLSCSLVSLLHLSAVSAYVWLSQISLGVPTLIARIVECHDQAGA